MAKIMAKVEGGVIVNVEWCADNTQETETLKNMGTRPAVIGDSYAEGNFYKDGTAIQSSEDRLSDAERALHIIFGGDL